MNSTLITSSAQPGLLGRTVGGVGSATVNVTNSIVRSDTGTDIAGAGCSAGPKTVDIVLDHSNYATETDPGGDLSITNPGTPTNQTAAPAFVNAAAGDFHQTAASAGTLNLGTATGLLPGELDLDGLARSQGAAPDIGAYEMPFVAPPPGGGGPEHHPAAGDQEEEVQEAEEEEQRGREEEVQEEEAEVGRGRIGSRAVSPDAKPDLRNAKAWKALEKHHAEIGERHLREIFAEDPDRGERLVAEGAGLFLDYSKHRVTDETLKLLVELAKERDVEGRRDAMFAGEHINVSEDRAVLHVALRMPKDRSLIVDGEDVVKQVHEVLDRMGDFSEPRPRRRVDRPHRQADPQRGQRRHRRLGPGAR